MREELIGDISEGDLTQKKGIGAPERIRGLAQAGTLASAIKRLQAHLDGANIALTVRALDVTLKQASSKANALPAKDRANLCLIAVLEKLEPLCTVCKGRREIRVPGQAVIQCGECGGSGARRFSDDDRARVTKRKLTNEEEMVLAEAASLYGHHDSLGETVAFDAIYGDEL